MANRGQPRPQAQDAGAGIDQLADLFNRVLQQQPAHQAPRDRFKPPRYNGTGDVELFIQQFTDVCRANDWDEATSFLQLRTSLEQSAADCGRGITFGAVLENLRARFGLTVRQARDRLVNIRREANQSVHALGMEVTRLTALAYPQIAAAERVVLAVETFKRALDNRALNRHLLAIQVASVDDVARAAEEFFQVGGFNSAPRPRHHIAAMDLEEPEMVTAVATVNPVLEQLIQAVKQNTELISKMLAGRQASLVRNDDRRSSNQRYAPSQHQWGRASDQDRACFNCGDPSHFKRNCPKLSGNDENPQ